MCVCVIQLMVEMFSVCILIGLSWVMLFAFLTSLIMNDCYTKLHVLFLCVCVIISSILWCSSAGLHQKVMRLLFSLRDDHSLWDCFTSVLYFHSLTGNCFTRDRVKYRAYHSVQALRSWLISKWLQSSHLYWICSVPLIFLSSSWYCLDFIQLLWSSLVILVAMVAAFSVAVSLMETETFLMQIKLLIISCPFWRHKSSLSMWQSQSSTLHSISLW